MSSHPSYNYAAVTPNDSADLPGGLARSFSVGTPGNVTLVNPSTGATVQFTTVSAGQIIPVFSRRVMATGTTASGIVALF